MILIFDCNYICYRSFFTTLNDLSTEEIRTGIIFGFLNTVLNVAKKFHYGDKHQLRINRICFAWDSKKSLRKIKYPIYKEQRKKDIDEEEKQKRQIAFAQFTEIRKKVLPELGFKNVYLKPGFEADDIIANIVFKLGLNTKYQHVIISSDEDLYQLLNLNNSIYNFKTLYSVSDFITEYKIDPSFWVKVKAIAGCSSDNVKGIERVGEKTAIKYLLDEYILKKEFHLKRNSKNYKAITSKEGKKIIERNTPLVKLPYEEFKVPIKRDELTLDNFIEVFEEYDFKSFLKRDRLKEWKDNFNLK